MPPSRTEPEARTKRRRRVYACDSCYRKKVPKAQSPVPFVRVGDADLAGSDRDADIFLRLSATVRCLGATGAFITASRVPTRATRRSSP
jgi:hypothetical protein